MAKLKQCELCGGCTYNELSVCTRHIIGALKPPHPRSDHHCVFLWAESHARKVHVHTLLYGLLPGLPGFLITDME